MVGEQAVHNLGSAAATVEDIAHQVQVVDSQALDERGKRLDKVVGAGGLQDGLHDSARDSCARPGACATTRR